MLDTNKYLAKTQGIFFYSLFLFFSVIFADLESPAAENKKLESPQFKPGMETVEIGDAKILVPRGAKVYKDGDLIKVEDLSEYSARNFEEIQKRFNTLQEKYEEMKKEIEQLRETVACLIKKTDDTKDKKTKPE